MKVRTKKRHGNAFPPQHWKNPGRIYELPDVAGRNLVAAGLVEEVSPETGDDEGSDEGKDADAGSY